jgi:hypothetical protein
MLLESLIMLLKNIYGTGVTHDDRHLRSLYFYSTGHWLLMANLTNVITLVIALSPTKP